MGLFDKVLGKKDEGPLKLNQHEALGSVCILAVADDGAVEDNELRRVVSGLAEKRLSQGYKMDDLARLLQGSAKNVQRRGPATVMEAAKNALTQELR